MKVAELSTAAAPATVVAEKPKPKVIGGAGAEWQEREATVTVVESVPRNMPSRQEARRLLQIVTGKYPQFGKVDEDHFYACLRFVLSCGHSDRVSDKSISWWMDDCCSYCSNHNLSTFAFLAAVIVSGVEYQDISRCPYDLGFKLIRHGSRNVGDDGWKGLLHGEPVREPLPGPSLDRSLGYQQRYG